MTLSIPLSLLLQRCRSPTAKYRAVKDIKYLYSFFKYLLIIASFGIGVSVGFIAIQYYAEKSILLCELFIIIAFVMLQREERLF